jgi:hypothetical protein
VGALTAGLSAVGTTLLAQQESLTALLAQSEERTTTITAMKAQMDAHGVEMAEMKKLIAKRESLFGVVRWTANLIIKGVGLAVVGAALMSVAWAVKKLTGVDITPWLHLAEVGH